MAGPQIAQGLVGGLGLEGGYVELGAVRLVTGAASQQHSARGRTAPLAEDDDRSISQHIGDEGRLHFIRVKAFESRLYLSEDGSADIRLETGSLVGGLPLFKYHERLALAGPGEALDEEAVDRRANAKGK